MVGIYQNFALTLVKMYPLSSEMLPTQVASRDCSSVLSSSWAYASSLLSTEVCWFSV